MLISHLLKSPLVFPANLVFLFEGKVVLDVECPANLLRTLSLYHVRHSLAGQVEQVLYVQIVSSLKTDQDHQKQPVDADYSKNSAKENHETAQ